MGKQSALTRYRAMEITLAEIRERHAKAEEESPEETALVDIMTTVWTDELTAADKDMLRKEVLE